MQLAGWPTVAAIGVAKPEPGLLELVAVFPRRCGDDPRRQGQHLEVAEVDHRRLPSFKQHEPDDQKRPLLSYLPSDRPGGCPPGRPPCRGSTRARRTLTVCKPYLNGEVRASVCTWLGLLCR